MLTVAKRSLGKSGQLSCMPIGKRNGHTVQGEIAKADERVSGEAWFRLFAVCNNGRTSFFESCNGIPQCRVFRRTKVFIRELPDLTLPHLKTANSLNRQSGWSSRLQCPINAVD